MAIEGFDYKAFAEELSSQAGELVSKDLQDFQRKYVINTIKNFATLSGEAIYNDEKANFNAEQAMFLTQIIAEWSFHKSVDVIKSGILPDYWDGIMQKIAFTIFEIAKQMISKNLPQDEILQVVEHHVKKTYTKVLQDLKERKIIDEAVSSRAESQSNIDDMMHQMQDEKVKETIAEEVKNAGHSPNLNSKILKLATVALLLKQVSQDKVQTILNKFNPKDAKTIIQYMQMSDLENKLDKNITMKCLQEIRTNLPEPKYISPDKILAKMNIIFGKTSKEKIEKIVLKERPEVKEFITKSLDGEFHKIPTKVANIIAQHLEETIS
jgi:hypothetical protein